MAFFQELTYWHWWVLGVVLIILEVFSPGAFFLWMGIAAGVVGFVLMLVPGLDWEFQLLFFGLFSVVSIVLWRLNLSNNPTKTDQPALNRRGEQYVGREFSLVEPIVGGVGRIRVDDTSWKVTGRDCPATCMVKVTAVDGMVLKVEVRDAEGDQLGAAGGEGDTNG